MLKRKLAHIRLPGYGQRTWSGARWITPGPSLSRSVYDVPSITLPPRVTKWTQNGVFTPVPFPAREARISAMQISNPLPFQSYFRVHWEGMFGASANLSEGARSLPFRGTPNAPGQAEGQALIPYNPWPSATDVYPKLNQF